MLCMPAYLLFPSWQGVEVIRSTNLPIIQITKKASTLLLNKLPQQRHFDL